jgi:CHAT domain-containing protein/tetratricopeptide (TPR) repeat protein
MTLWAASASPEPRTSVDLFPDGEGVIVVDVAPGLAAAANGVRPGDLLTGWSQGDASGGLRSPFDLAEVELEYGPRGPVRITGRRGDEALAVVLFPDDWGCETRPRLEHDADAYTAATRSREQGDFDAAVAALTRIRERTTGDEALWLLVEVARVEAARQRTDAADAALEQAARVARETRRTTVEAQVLARLGSTWRAAGDDGRAAEAYKRALEARRRLGPDGVATTSLAEPLAHTRQRRGDVEAEVREQVGPLLAIAERSAPESIACARALLGFGRIQQEQESAQRLYGRAITLLERLAPDSMLFARVLTISGRIERDLEARLARFERALALLERLAPQGAEMASLLSGFATAADAHGDAARALELHRRGLALVERSAPGTRRHASGLSALGTYWLNRGDPAAAEPLLRRALEIDERLAPGSVFVGIHLLNLSDLYRSRRDLASAEAYVRRALQLTERYDPAGDTTGAALSHLGRIQQDRGDLAGSEETLRRALAVMSAASPRRAPDTRQSLGETLARRGKLDEAQALYRQNLEDARAGNGSHYGVADAHYELGALAARRGDLADAEQQHRAALGLRRVQQPGSVWLAESCHSLGRVLVRLGRDAEALALHQEALAALETQGRRLGGSGEALARFRAHYQEYYRDLEELLLRLGREPDAFDVVERARARAMVALLATRDLGSGTEVPEELERARRAADGEHDRLFRALQDPETDAGKRADLTRRLSDAIRAQEHTRARIRAAAPRAAALRDPAPLDLAGVRRSLGVGTLLLAFSLGPDGGRVYAVGPGPDDFAVRAIPGRDVLRDEVHRFREALGTHLTTLGRAAVDARCRALVRMLLEPVSEPLRRAERVLIVPDGPLYLLPWAALRDPTGGRYLVERASVNVASSATLYDMLTRKSPDGAGSGAMAVGFGDPAYPSGPATTAAEPLARARAAGLDLLPLPGTRREVAALRALRDDARLLLGSEATEEQAKTVGREARYVHFACHGFLDERFPLESGLALAIPQEGAADGENGFLQAWEVFESMRLDADLVTLSACSTGLGEEMGGEGLLGLTWAFQFAGARSVLASLWEVNDDATATLMTHFYRHLAAGVPKAEALRRAQVALLRKRTTAAPYFWAGFTLVGDGR